MESDPVSTMGESIVSSLIKEVSGIGNQLGKLKDENDDYSPFEGIQKAVVLQQAKKFNEGEFVKNKPSKCRHIITQLLYLLYQNETFTATETTNVFFGCTKLFQSKNPNLRRMLYLFIKELASATQADEVIIVIQSLVKDMNSTDALHAANAIRVLSKIVDSQFLTSIDRFFKQAIVHKNPVVASAALVSGLHLAENQRNHEVVRRWVSEVNEAINTPHDMVQYHALQLLHKIRAHDMHAVAKVVLQLSRTMLRSPLAMCQLVRYAYGLLERDEISENNRRSLLDFLDSCLRAKHEMVIYEAARAICRMNGATVRDLSAAIGVLQMFLSSSKSALRFAAVRTLSQVAIKYPDAVTKCNDDMEVLINDSNRSIATLALTTLLKTGGESSVERLMSQISSFMGEIGDDFKIVVVNAIYALCLKYPKKHAVLLLFLSSTLREEGGFEFKKTIVDSILGIMNAIPESKELGLYHLCEFIEDCEYSSLSVRVLHLLGNEASEAEKPAKFIRFVYNRVILEKPSVRAAAVSALAKFGAKVEELRPSVISLIRRSLRDDDNEVRDRATTLLRILEQEPFGELQRRMLIADANVAGYAKIARTLRRQLELYRLKPSGGMLTFDALPEVEDEPEETSKEDDEEGGDVGGSMARGDEKTSSAAEDLAELYRIPQFADLGAVFKTSKGLKLSEAEAEYVVACDKHIFETAVVFQFRVKNTIEDCLLENVRVEMSADGDDEGWIEDPVIVAAKQARFREPASCFVMIKRDTDVEPSECTFACELLFTAKDVVGPNGEVDEDDEGEEDQFPLEDVDVEKTDFLSKARVSSFRPAWEKLGSENEIVQKFGFQGNTVAETVEKVIQFLGLATCEGTGSVDDDERAHMLLLGGKYLGGTKILVRAYVQQTKGGNGCVLKMAVRSDSSDACKFVVECVQ
eukprot:g1790.t1